VVLRVGPLEVDPPVVLAPMAGVTTPAFRRLCRHYGAGLYVSEMVSARGLVGRDERTWRLARPAADERPRSVQLSGTDAAVVGAAVRLLVDELGVEHVDLNMGCPTRKVTRHGGGAALPWKSDRFAAVVGAAVGAAGAVPVTVKMRIGIDDAHRTHLDAGRVAAEAGVAAVALHARTAAQWYSGRADWAAIGALREHVAGVPVLGNGDVFAGADAVAMIRRTGCDGVVIGRGCLGRPWLFRDLADALAGRSVRPAPALGEVAAVIAEHAGLLAAAEGEARACRALRRHLPWYLLGYPVAPPVRDALARVGSLADLDRLIRGLDPGARPAPDEADGPRGPVQGPQPVALPDQWLSSRSLPADPARE